MKFIKALLRIVSGKEEVDVSINAIGGLAAQLPAKEQYELICHIIDSVEPFEFVFSFLKAVFGYDKVLPLSEKIAGCESWDQLMDWLEMLFQQDKEPQDEHRRLYFRDEFRNWRGRPGKLLRSRWREFLRSPRFFALSRDKAVKYLEGNTWLWGAEAREIEDERKSILTELINTDPPKAQILYGWKLDEVSIEDWVNRHSIAYHTAAELVDEPVLYNALREVFKDDAYVLEIIVKEHAQLSA